MIIPKHIHVIVNPASGQPEPILYTLNQVFRPAGVQWDVSVTYEEGDGARFVRRAIESGADAIASYGGDGTVMDVINGLVGTDVPLLVLPGGTNNVFSRDLSVPNDLRKAAELAVNQDTVIRSVDIGLCGETYFALLAGIGYHAKRDMMTTRELKDKYGKLAYMIATLKASKESPVMKYRAILDGTTVEFEAYTCMVVNTFDMMSAGWPVAPGVSSSDGKLDLIAQHSTGLKSNYAYLKSLAGLQVESEEYQHFQAQEIMVEPEIPQGVVLDGEPIGNTPLTFTAVPGAIRAYSPGPGTNH